jgi:hypothetical protein
MSPSFMQTRLRFELRACILCKPASLTTAHKHA